MVTNDSCQLPYQISTRRNEDTFEDLDVSLSQVKVIPVDSKSFDNIRSPVTQPNNMIKGLEVEVNP